MKCLTQQELAKLTGVSVSYIGHIERGTKHASLDIAAQISVALGVSVDYFIFGRTCRDDKNEIIREYLRQQLAACAGSNGSCS